MTIPAVPEVQEFPPLVSLSAKVAAAYIASRKDVPIERVGEVIEGVYRSLVRIAAVEDTGSAAVCRFLDTPVGQEAMGRPLLRIVGGIDHPRRSGLRRAGHRQDIRVALRRGP